jgi:hypothetical protein
MGGLGSRRAAAQTTCQAKSAQAGRPPSSIANGVLKQLVKLSLTKVGNASSRNYFSRRLKRKTENDMKTKWSRISIALWLSFGLLMARAEAQTPLFDARKSRQEIEIMKGIIQTTLRFAIQEIGQSASSDEDKRMGLGGELTNIDAIYLYGQGVVFLIPLSPQFDAIWANPSLVGWLGPLLAQSSRQALKRAPGKAQAKKIEPQSKMAKDQLAPANPAPLPNQPQKYWAEARNYLIEAIANHGDSLTILKPQEYITLILTTEAPPSFFEGNEEAVVETSILSVKKATVVDYKIGKLSLEEFKSKVLIYGN